MPEEQAVSVQEIEKIEEAKEMQQEIEQEKTKVDEIIDLFKSLGRFKTLEERRREKLERIRKDYDALPEDSYKKTQLENKILLLEKKISPNWIWDSSNGAYKLAPTQRAEKINRSSKRKKHNG